MDDLISRQAAIDHFKSITVATSIGNKYNEGFVDGLNFAVEHLKTMPSVQPDIIVCADCKHWVCHDRRCGYWNHGVKPLEWCCYGERRTDAE